MSLVERIINAFRWHERYITAALVGTLLLASLALYLLRGRLHYLIVVGICFKFLKTFLIQHGYLQAKPSHLKKGNPLLNLLSRAPSNTDTETWQRLKPLPPTAGKGLEARRQIARVLGSQ